MLSIILVTKKTLTESFDGFISKLYEDTMFYLRQLQGK